ncbi:hypothetical protein RvY_06508-2 [Ramazzottius varieornatus]|uniref:Chitin-binding type-2 domain-containing protein n=1 Tax=Ramazzottius varieornatus TaxID=947166 RepID=A0A1D1UYV6_RAMVA|nr:hypothetical protein RvY_06508-2 [Ramazzottius varieornatus]
MVCQRTSLLFWLVWIISWCSIVVQSLPAPGSHGAENSGSNHNSNNIRPANLQAAHNSVQNHPPYNPPQQFHSGNQQGSVNGPNSINMEAASSNSYGSYSGGGGGYDGGSNYGGDNNYGFDCYGKKPGMYGDASYDCRIYHVCQADGRSDTLYCPKWTRFNNYNGVCDWHFKVDNYCNPLYKEDSYGSGGSNYGGGSTYGSSGGGGGY